MRPDTPSMRLGENVDPIFLQLDKHGGSFWEGAACRSIGDPDAWFVDYSQPSDDDLWRLNNALRICETCPIKDKCLQAGLTDTELRYGVWGGYLPGERWLMRNGNSKPTPFFKQAISNARSIRARLDKMKYKMDMKKFRWQNND